MAGLDLAAVQTPTDLGKCLDEVRATRTLKLLVRLSEGRAVQLSRSTISDVLNGKRPPSLVWLKTFLDVCEVPPGQVPAWTEALNRATRSVTMVSHDGVIAEAAHLRDLGVHPAIRVHAEHDDQPPYVPRDYDDELRHRLVAGGFIVLVGRSSVGKTRSLAEAIRTVHPKWHLVQPADVADIEALAEKPPAETIVWLDDLQRYLSAEPGLGIATVRSLVRAGALVVGTLWPEDYQVVSALRRPGHSDPLRRIRDVLASAHVVDVPQTLTDTELGRAAELAKDDARLRTALDDADLGVTQVLAAGPALIRWWEQGDPYGAAVVSVAADARLLGVTSPLSRALLNDAAYGYLTPAERATAAPDWLERALAYATTPLHGAASAVAPVDGGDIGVTAGYVIADFLLQHARSTRRTVAPPDSTWQALLDHADPAMHPRVGDQAERRLRYRYAETAYRNLARAGDLWGAAALTLLLASAGRVDEAQELARTFHREASGSLHNGMRWNLFTGLLVFRRELRQRLRDGRFAEAIAMERPEPTGDDRTTATDLPTPPTDSDIDTLRQLANSGSDQAAMWLAVLAAQRGSMPELLTEVHAGTPLAAELYILGIESVDPTRAAQLRRDGLPSV